MALVPPSRVFVFFQVILLFVSWGTVSAQDCDPEETARFSGSGADRLGSSIAISNDVAVVGAPSAEVNSIATGSASVFRFNGSRWVLEATLAPSGAPGDDFGRAVAISGDTILIGSPGDDRNGDRSGSAYIFRYDGLDWNQEDRLVPSVAAPEDHFGWSVALSGDVALVGAFFHDNATTDAGAAFVFHYTGTKWEEEAVLVASDAQRSDGFGRAVAISGNTIAVGATYDDDNGGDSGSAYLFGYDGNTWNQTSKLLALDGVEGDHFGMSVSISGVVVVVGSPDDDDNDTNSGSAYIYNAISGHQVSKILPSNGRFRNHFGASVNITPNLLVVGAPAPGNDEFLAGQAYLFRFDGFQWIEESMFIDVGGQSGDGMGYSVAVNSSFSMIGARGKNDNEGAAFVYKLNCSTCLELTVDNLIAGEKATLTITGGTPGAKAITLYSTKLGETSVNNFAGYCATFGIKINQDKVIGGINRLFNTESEITFKVPIPSGASGMEVYFQSAQQGTCPGECVSNLVEAVVG